MDYTVQDGTLWFNTWKMCAFIANMVYGLSDSKNYLQDWRRYSRGEVNTKIRVASWKSEKKKLEKGTKKKNK